MRVRRLYIVLLMVGILSTVNCLYGFSQTAEQTTEQPTEQSTAQDTIRLQDLKQTIEFNDDALLLELVRQQGIHLADSLAAIDSTMLSSEEAMELMLALQERIQRDSIVRDSLRIDSIRLEAQRLIDEIGMQTEIHDIRIEKHIFRDEEEDREDIRRAIRQEFSPWYKEARTLVQFTQNYITPNWYKGGSSSLALLALVKGQINYKKNKFVWENTGEWRMGLSTTGKSDTIHKVNVTDDIFKIYSRAGYEVYKQLFIVGSVEFQTTFLPSWKTNSTQVKSTFMTPIRYNMGLGVDYKPIDWVSINFMPATFKLVHTTISDSTRVDVTVFGIDKGKKTLAEFGSSLRVELKYKPLRELEIYSLLYFYTNYRQVEFDWQIDVDFIINRFLSTHLTLHPRFDSTVKSDEPQHIQFKELLSIGFNHYFR